MMILLPHDTAVIQTEAPVEGTKPGLWGHALADWPTKVAAATESIKLVAQVDPVHASLLPAHQTRSEPPGCQTLDILMSLRHRSSLVPTQRDMKTGSLVGGWVGGWLQTSTVGQGRGKPNPTRTVCVLPKETAQLTPTHRSSFQPHTLTYVQVLPVMPRGARAQGVDAWIRVN